MRNQRTDAGSYNRPAQIQARGPRMDDGQGGAPASWVTVRSPFIHLQSGNFARGSHRSYQFSQLYPTASHWAEFRYANDTTIDATMTLLVDGRRFQILGAMDMDLEHVITVLGLEEYQAKGSK